VNVDRLLGFGQDAADRQSTGRPRSPAEQFLLLLAGDGDSTVRLKVSPSG
jgi:hypothetical protein